ncbi:hypothetical protein [Polaribacter ponticola]|uniref:Uncharacterized protein n=1 Tax=Polaribacter ponticola TaxID=2978475 RepID=A0ABT5S8V4_9FLAO|nr:hypothetical protein [Polaribacter sp. MSW5]MDD7914254.1 hypothetical protein [Polaribacter sp. MSW5]
MMVLFLDTQKILYIPHPTNGTGNVNIVNTLEELTPPYTTGDLIWITSYGENNNTSLLIWNGNSWVPVNEDFDPTNELGLIVVSSNIDRDTQFTNPKNGDQVWNKECKCIQVFDDTIWESINSKAINGLHTNNNTIKLGGELIEPTTITVNELNTLAIKGLETSLNDDDKIIVVDKDTGVLMQKTLPAITSTSQKTEVVIYAIDGQIEFKTPLNITNVEKINVFRNGVNISFTALNDKTIKLEPEAVCYENDKIRIVQLY